MQETFNVARDLRKDILLNEEWTFSGSLQVLKHTYEIHCICFSGGSYKVLLRE